MRNKRPTSQRSNRLPLEVWQHIFLLACTDGGCTGYALTLVSKFFRDASQLVRFHSLAFASLRQIEGFLAFAERATTTQAKKPKVHHLLLSFSRSPSHDTSPEFGRVDDVYGANPPEPDAWFIARQAREQEKAAWDKRFVVVLSALFDLLGPHLETLALLQSDAFALPPVRHRLPRLRELTLLVGITVILNGDEDVPGANLSGSPLCARPSSAPSSRRRSHAHPSTSSPSPSPSAPVPSASSSSSGPSFGFEDSSVDDALATPATRSLGHASDSEAGGEHVAHVRFPSLERLHIVCGRHRDWTLRNALAHLPRLAPSLECLRISNATYTHGSHGCVAAFLRSILHVVQPDDQESADFGPGSRTHALGGEGDVWPTMPQLRRVAVHSVPPPVDANCEASQKEYRALAEAMEEVLTACELAPDKHFQWAESERTRHQAWEDLCRARWIERIY